MSLNELIARGIREQSERFRQYNEVVRRRAADAVDSLGLVLSGESFKERLLKNNSLALAPGEHGGSVLDREDTALQGVAPGAVITRRLVVESDAVIDNITISTGDGPNCVNIKSPATVIFRGCVFERPLDSSTVVVAVDAGAKAVFLGCVFRGSGPAVSPVVSHAGPAASVQIAFCYNKTNPSGAANTLFSGGTATGTGNV